MDIYLYDSVAECIKCGQRKWPTPCSFETHFLDKHNAKLYNSKLDCEALLLKCNNCGYRWLEHTKDYVEPKQVDFLPQPKELTIEEQADKEVTEICTVLAIDENHNKKVSSMRSPVLPVLAIVTVWLIIMGVITRSMVHIQ